MSVELKRMGFETFFKLFAECSECGDYLDASFKPPRVIKVEPCQNGCKKEAFCDWYYDENRGLYESGCGVNYYIDGSTVNPVKHGYTFCPRCGNTIRFSENQQQ